MIRNVPRTIKMSVLFVLPIMLLLSSCAPKSGWHKEAGWNEPDLAHLPGQQDYPDADAVLLLNQGKMEIFGGNGAIGFSVYENHRIIKVLNNRGHRFANIAIPYSEPSQVKDIQARTISPEGKVTILKEENIYDVNLYPQFVFYSDQRAKLFTLPAVEDGSVIEYSYKIDIASRTFWHSWTFQEDIPTLESKFTLIKPSEWDVDYKIYGIDIQPVIVDAPTGFKSSYTWEAHDIPAIKAEYGMPPRREITARLALAPVGFKNWDDVANWYFDLSEPQIKPDKNVVDTAREILAGATTASQTASGDAAGPDLSDMGKAKRIYEWVRDKVRYIAVEVGLGGFQPSPSPEVCRNLYGDCKDMTTLLCAMLREEGVDAREVLVSTWQNGIPDTTLPSPLHFNHVIAFCPGVGDSGLWLDATEKGAPFGYLPWYDQGLPVLVVGKNGAAELVTTPQARPQDNLMQFDWQADLDSTGYARVAGYTRFRGAYASELREELLSLSPDKMRLWMETYIAQRCSGAVLDSFLVTGLMPVEDPLVITTFFHSSSFAVKRGNRMVLRPGAIVATGLPDYFRSPKRIYPIRFKFGFLTKLDLHINLPEGWQVQRWAENDSIRSDFGYAMQKWESNGSGISYHSAYLLEGKDIQPDKYHQFQEFLDAVQENGLAEAELARTAPAINQEAVE